jgi:hydrogenase expression/formation protein HypE
MNKAAEKAGVQVVTGDTKVVPKGAVDKIFINTSGIGMIPDGVDIASQNARNGDLIILSGTIADHGMTVLTQREGLAFDSPLRSDTAPLNHMVSQILSVCKTIHVLRDPTRGGLGTALNEIAGASKVGIRIEEQKIPIKNETAGICELLGFDPLYVANEGKLIAIVDAGHADDVLSIIRKDEYGKDACIIGEVVADHCGRVVLQTRIGGTRIVDMLTGGQLPRIC